MYFLLSKEGINIPNVTEKTDINTRAVVAPANTVYLLYFNDNAAANKNVLSPISEIKIELNPFIKAV